MHIPVCLLNLTTAPLQKASTVHVHTSDPRPVLLNEKHVVLCANTEPFAVSETGHGGLNDACNNGSAYQVFIKELTSAPG